MPVHLETHTPDLDVDPSTTKGRILAFLYQHPEFGYKPAEIRDELDIPHGTATTTLARLHTDGYIDKTPDGYYHALPERPELERFAASVEQVNRLAERFADQPTVEATQTMSRDAQLEETNTASSEPETVEEELRALDDASKSDGEE
ncbi:MAG: MarR family transcriptional regulator [Halodesulfurarchaeum sp.]